MRVLIATATAGAGHLAAASALDEAWRSLRPEDLVRKLDLVEFFSPLHRKIHADGYVTLVEHAPELWGMLFGKTDNPRVARGLNKLKRAFPSKSRARFAGFLHKFAPDAVLCTHYVALETLGDRRSKGSRSRPARANRPPFVVSVVTDFEAHALWMDACVDLYCVAAEETKARLVARGAQPEARGRHRHTHLGKVPEQACPARGAQERGFARRSTAHPGSQRRFRHGARGQILAELDKLKTTFQTLVVTGRNQEMRGTLATRDYKHPTRVLGFSSNMHELMAVAELIITKPGGLTSSEALAMGKPLLIINPIPGQEAANSDFLLERGAAAKVNRVEDLPFRVEQLFVPGKLAQMARAAKALGRPEAAQTICNEVAQRTAPSRQLANLKRLKA